MGKGGSAKNFGKNLVSDTPPLKVVPVLSVKYLIIKRFRLRIEVDVAGGLREQDQPFIVRPTVHSPTKEKCEAQKKFPITTRL